MVEDYFESVISDLTIEDLQMLGLLYDREAVASFKSLRNSEAFVVSGLSEATFRRVLYRLTASRFVSTVSQQRSHSIYITQYGVAALRQLNVINEEEVTA